MMYLANPPQRSSGNKNIEFLAISYSIRDDSEVIPFLYLKSTKKRFFACRSFHFLSVFFKPKQAYFNSIFDGIDFFLDEI